MAQATAPAQPSLPGARTVDQLTPSPSAGNKVRQFEQEKDKKQQANKEAAQKQQSGAQQQQQQNQQKQSGNDEQQKQQRGTPKDGDQQQAGQASQEPRPDQTGEKKELQSAGARPMDRSEAQRLLDALGAGEKNLQVWRFGKEKAKEPRHDVEKDW